MIVADDNLVICTLLKGEHTRAAEAVRAKHRRWLVPGLFTSELLSALTKYLRDGSLSRDAAVRAYRRGTSLVTFAMQRSDPVAVLNLCARSDCSSYDAKYVALAMSQNVPLVTADQQLIQAFPEQAIDFRSFARG